MSAAELGQFEALLTRRLRREPVQRLLGHWEFWSLELELAPATLVPRADSESVVEAALELVADRRRPCRLLDLGTGSGALLLALLTELPAAWGLGVDRAVEAVLVARANARRLGLGGRAAFLVGDWATALAGPFDLVVCNPPYIATGDLADLQPEVRLHEPALALLAGADGLEAYRLLAPALAPLLVQGGHAVLEYGEGQGPSVAALLISAGLKIVGTRADLTGRQRALIARKAA